MTTVKYKKTSSIKEFIDAIRLRVDVFVKEQGFEPGWEPDEEDKDAYHFIAMVDDKIIATARVLYKNGEAKIGRMVVHKDHRGKRVGKGLVEFIVNELKKENPKRIWMQAQYQVKDFYEKCGFKVISDKYNLWGWPHIDMEYKQ